MTTTPEVLPLPESTYQLLLDAARAWPDGIATQWIPDPGAYTDCLTWTYTDLAGTVTRIANGLASLGVRRPDAVTLCGPNTSMLFAATLAAQAAGIAAPVNPALSEERIAELIRRTGSRILVAAGPELNPPLWKRLVTVAREARMNAILAVRPDGASGRPPALAAGGGVPTAYLEDLIARQPSASLTAISRPAAGDLAAFVHTGGTTGAPKIAAQTHANQLACARGIAESSGLAPGEAMLGGLPLFHVNALIVTGIAPLFSGARVVWPGQAGYRDPALYQHFWKIVEHYRIAAMSAVPTVYGTLARLPVDADISSLRLPIVGASPLPSAVREGFARRTGVAPAGRLRAHRGDLRQHLDPARRGTDRIGGPGPARPAGEGRPDRRGRVAGGLRSGRDRGADDRRAGRVRRLPHRSGARRPAGEPRRRRPGRLAGHRGPRESRRGRVRLPHRPGQGPHHPGRPQHRPPRHRGSPAPPPRRSRRRGRRVPGPALG